MNTPLMPLTHPQTRALRLTGNPFVDAGLGIIAARRGKKSVADLTSEDARTVVAELLANAHALKSLKVLSIFWQNNPFTGINPGTFPLYRETLEVLARPEPSAVPGACQVCGTAPRFRAVNRSWFPLSGGADDACTLPNLGGKWVCADCFRAAVVLPLGCRFCKNGPYIIHVGEPDWQVEAVEYGVESVRSQINGRASGNAALKEAKTKLQGRTELLEVVSGSTLWDHTEGASPLPTAGATIIAFNNDKSARLLQVHLPAQALAFFGEVLRRDLRPTFLAWAAVCSGETRKEEGAEMRNPLFDQICEDIEQRRSVAPLLAAIVRERAGRTRAAKGAEAPPVLPRKEKELLAVYEDTLLDKSERFEVFERLAQKVRTMKETHRYGFVRQLSNLQKKASLLSLLQSYTKSPDKYGLTLTVREIRALNEAPEAEAVSLLFLLCVAEAENDEPGAASDGPGSDEKG